MQVQRFGGGVYNQHDCVAGELISEKMQTPHNDVCDSDLIRCIFLGEFHPVEGPKISCQFPEDFITKDAFDTISAYIIPKLQIEKCTMTINTSGHKIVGCPIRIDSARYERNVYLFNLCFVFDSWSKTEQYEPVVMKLCEHLTFMEEESGFVSSGTNKLPTLLAHLLHDLNTHRKATIVEGETVMHLKVLEIRKDPPSVNDYDVPVILASVGLPCKGPGKKVDATQAAGSSNSGKKHADLDLDSDWDLTTKQLLPYIDGYNYISKIAADTNVDKTLVKSCIQNLVYYGVVTLIPVFKFSNMYRATPNLKRIFRDQELQMSCLKYITQGLECKKKPTLSNIIKFLCALKQGTTLKTVCERFTNTDGANFDVRRLIVFAQLHGLIIGLKSYPVYIRSNPRPNAFNNHVESVSGIRRLFTGEHSIDDICCLARIDLPTLEKIIEDDPNVLTIVK